MKIGIIAAGGRLGGKLATEAADRGHTVTAVINKTPCRESRVTVLQKSLFDLTPADVAGLDVLFSAFGSGFTADPVINRQAVNALAKLVEGTGIHLILVGGAGCLYSDETCATFLYETPDYPAFLKGISHNLHLGLGDLRRTEGVDWTFICPVLLLDQDGPRTGEYLTRSDGQLIFNEDGNSYVSYDDLAMAMMDFGEAGSFKRELVAVASRRGGPRT